MEDEETVIISDLEKNDERIHAFFSRLSTETQYFPEVNQCIANADLLIGVRGSDYDNLYGVAGFERYHKIPRIFFLILNEYQGRGLADILMTRSIERIRAKKECMIIAFIDRNNTRSLSLHLKHGFIMLGARWKFFILFKSINCIGKFVITLLRFFFLFIALRDSIVENVIEPRKTARMMKTEKIERQG